MTDQGAEGQEFAAELPPRNERGAAGQTILPELGEPRRRGAIWDRLPNQAQRIDYDNHNPASSQESSLVEMVRQHVRESQSQTIDDWGAFPS